MEEDCSNRTNCPNCQKNNLGFVKKKIILKRVNEIMKVKYRRNITFLEARKIVEF